MRPLSSNQTIADLVQRGRYPGFRLEEAVWYRLLYWRSEEALTASLAAAPHLSQVRPLRLLEQARGSLQVILLTEDRYAARQTAVHLATLACKRWSGDVEPADTCEGPVLAVVTAAGLDRGLPAGLPHRPGALLLEAPEGRPLTETDKRRMEEALFDAHGSGAHCFLSLMPEQVDEAWVEELRFCAGYQVCRVGRPEQEYLCRVLRVLGAELGLELREVDLDRVVNHLRSYRGRAFCEEDLERLLLWCVQRQNVLTQPLRTADLLFRPVCYRWNQQEGGETDV